jgi:hypothetical protein
MRSVHLGEREQRVLNCPLPRHTFLNPVASNSKVCVGVAGLPCITRQANLSADGGPLM